MQQTKPFKPTYVLLPQLAFQDKLKDTKHSSRLSSKAVQSTQGISRFFQSAEDLSSTQKSFHNTINRRRKLQHVFSKRNSFMKKKPLLILFTGQRPRALSVLPTTRNHLDRRRQRRRQGGGRPGGHRQGQGGQEQGQGGSHQVQDQGDGHGQGEGARVPGQSL